MDNRAVGIFDSGLGGLSAVRKLRALLPGEDIVFLGDTARLPYGSRDQETIRVFARDDMSYLCSNNVKCLVAACGTVSSNIMERDIVPFGKPFIGILRPAAEAAVKATSNGKIGILGTVATIASGSFKREVLSVSPEVTVFVKACPEFVPLIESGHISEDDPMLSARIEEYLSPLKENGVDTIILGCTHYPLISDAIAAYIGDNVHLIDSGAEEAKAVCRYLTENDLLSSSPIGKCSLRVTGKNDHFDELSPLFFNDTRNTEFIRISQEEFEKTANK